MRQIDIETRALADADLDAVSGGMVCTTNELRIKTDQGLLILGYAVCGNGPAIPYGDWQPAK